MHTGSVLPHWVLIRLFYGIALPCHVFYVTVLHDTFSLLLLTFWTWVFFFFFFFLGGMDIHYTSATITTSKKHDVHCKPAA